MFTVSPIIKYNFIFLLMRAFLLSSGYVTEPTFPRFPAQQRTASPPAEWRHHCDGRLGGRTASSLARVSHGGLAYCISEPGWQAGTNRSAESVTRKSCWRPGQTIESGARIRPATAHGYPLHRQRSSHTVGHARGFHSGRQWSFDGPPRLVRGRQTPARMPTEKASRCHPLPW